MSALPDISTWDDILPPPEPEPWLTQEDIDRCWRDAMIEDPVILRAMVRRALFPVPGDDNYGRENPLLQAAWLKAFPEDCPDGPTVSVAAE